MNFEDSKQAIVQIHEAISDATVGTGFLVADQYILTCAHVVQAALRNSASYLDKEISVTFLFAAFGEKQTARVVFYEFHELDDSQYEKRARDFAILYLPTPLPTSVKPIELSFLSQSENSPVKSLGFPRKSEGTGLNLDATIRGGIGGGWIQIQGTEQTDLSTEKGFSGAPVWCSATKSFVGMIVARHKLRPETKMGFMIPTEKLRRPLHVIEWHSLLKILEGHQSEVSSQISAAYQMCRPKNWVSPLARSLKEKLLDLVEMPAEGLAESKVVQFAAYLHNQANVDNIKTALLLWIAQYATDIRGMFKQILMRQEQSMPQTYSPCLLISVQADKVTDAEPYRVKAWLIQAPTLYCYSTGEGAEQLSSVEPQGYLKDGESIDTEKGVQYSQIAALVADYLDQVGHRGIDVQNLTVEFFLPLKLIGEAMERCEIPEQKGFGDPFPLGLHENCAHVLVRSQDRLELSRYRPRWKTKWTTMLKDLSESKATSAFVDGDIHGRKQLKDKLKPNTAFGLSLTRPPNFSRKGEIALLVTTGTPAAIWLRKQTPNTSICQCMKTKVLSRNLTDVPKVIWALRKNAPELESLEALEKSLELCHHLSFMWEDPERVPPEIDYIQSSPL